MNPSLSSSLASLALLLGLLAPAGAEPQSGQPGAPGLAILSSKVLTCAADPADPQVVDQALVLVKDGRIEFVGRARDAELPVGYEIVDVGDNWVMPGMIDLHSHVGGTFDINDMVFMTNPGLSARSAVVPGNSMVDRAVGGGVTTILFIPGSGTNVGGQGILLKIGHEDYEQMVLRDPGSLKLAQAGNPERWTIGVGRSLMNWSTRNTFRRGVAYAKRWESFEQGGGPEPKRDIQFDIFRSLYKGETQVSTHTQIYQVVMMTLSMIKKEFGLPVYIDHGTIGAWKAAGLAQEAGVPAILGPRSVDTTSRGFMFWAQNKAEGFRGVAAGYQENGHKMIGFNTDAPVIPQEELPLQAAMGVRYGFDDSKMDAVRGLTIVPAQTAGIADRVGSVEVGKDADLLILSGHPADPRTSIELVLVDGKRVYDPSTEQRRW